MGGVVEAIGDAVGSVVDAVGDAVEWVGDTASNIVEHALDNPVETALMVGLTVATGGAGAAALGLEAPLTALEASSAMAGVSGVSTLAHGGDLGDALTSAATTFAVAQGVNYAFDSFNAAGVPGEGGSTTTQFFDDGSSMQMFDDGSRLITDTSGAVTPVAADESLAAGLQPSGAETSPIPEPGPVETSTLPPVETPAPEVAPQPAGAPETTVPGPGDVGATPAPISPDNVMSGYDQAMADLAASQSQMAAPQYDTMEQLLADKGLMPTVAPADNLPDSFGNAVALDPNAPAIEPAKQYGSMEDLMYDKGLINDAQYKDLTGVAPVVDLSTPAGPMKDISTWDAMKDLGGAALDYAIENPLTTAGVLAGGAALMGSGQEQPAAPGEPAKKTYTYGAAPTIDRSGLGELWSAASKIYGGEAGLMNQLGIQPPKFESSFQPNAAPLLGGQAPGAGKVGLGALGQGFSYTPMGRAQTFDISTLTPEQIVQLQDMVARKKPGEGV